MKKCVEQQKTDPSETTRGCYAVYVKLLSRCTKAIYQASYIGIPTLPLLSQFITSLCPHGYQWRIGYSLIGTQVTTKSFGSSALSNSNSNH